jgi:hypothetical protein
VTEDWENQNAMRRAKAQLINTAAPNAARAADFLIGGRDNFEADRKTMRSLVASAPAIAEIPAAARGFRHRAVNYLAQEVGVGQFLDVGSGLVPRGNTHQIAQAADPASRTVYVESDPMVFSHMQALSARPGGAVACIEGDLGDVPAIVTASKRVLDFRRPVGVLLMSTLAHVQSTRAAAAVVAGLMDAVPSGSYLALYHLASDLDPAMAGAAKEWNRASPLPLTLRSHAELASILRGLDLVPPGLVPVCDWSPNPDDPRPALLVPVYAAVARKP